MARTVKKTDLAIDNSEVREIVKELKQFGKKDVLKTLSKFHREIAKEQLADSRVLARKQPVPKANKSAMGFTASGTRTEAKINIKSNDRYPTSLSMEFGRRFQYVPTRSGGTRAITQAEVGRLPHSRPGAKFPYRKWIGGGRSRGDSTFTKFGKEGYVVGRTISRNQKEILETYNDKMFDALTKAIK
tara:strand:- start:253 stop:813 length:561 start_codon:yes stop_codon:yes gene_type:complete